MTEFTFRPARRTTIPLLLAIAGPSSSGKTYSAFRLATGIQRVTGGKIFGIDTESNRMLHYAPLEGQKPDPARGKFDFIHGPFEGPFGSLRYLAAIRQAAAEGAKVIVVDSMSHEHNGAGGHLATHRAEVQRLLEKYKANGATEDTVNFEAWGLPAANRLELINGILTELKVNVIFCYRAKKKIYITNKEERKQGKPKVVSMGWQPVGGEDLIFEMMVKFLLKPGARGLPTLGSQIEGEQATIKIPEQFLHIFEEPRALDELHGQQMAEWAAGGDIKYPTDEEFATALKKASSVKTVDDVADAVTSFRGKPWTREQRAKLGAALDNAKKAIEAAA